MEPDVEYWVLPRTNGINPTGIKECNVNVSAQYEVKANTGEAIESGVADMVDQIVLSERANVVMIKPDCNLLHH